MKQTEERFPKHRMLLKGLDNDSSWDLILFVVDEIESLEFKNRFGAKDKFQLQYLKDVSSRWSAHFVGMKHKTETEAHTVNIGSRKEAVVMCIKNFIGMYETGKRKTDEVVNLPIPDAKKFMK